MEKSVRNAVSNDFSITLPCKFCLRTLICFCFLHFDWLGGGAYFDGMEDLEAGKFKKMTKSKFLMKNCMIRVDQPLNPPKIT